MPPPARPVWPPTPGFYLVRLVRKGPFVGASITHDDAGWSCMLDGVHAGPVADPVMLDDVEKIHTYGRMTSQAEVQFRIGVARWAQIHQPEHPAANPRRAVDVDTFTPI